MKEYMHERVADGVGGIKQATRQRWRLCRGHPLGRAESKAVGSLGYKSCGGLRAQHLWGPYIQDMPISTIYYSKLHGPLWLQPL